MSDGDPGVLRVLFDPLGWSLAVRATVIIALTLGWLALDLRKPAGKRHRLRELCAILMGGTIGAAFGICVDLVTMQLGPEYFEHGKGVGRPPDFHFQVLRVGATAGLSGGVICTAILLAVQGGGARCFEIFRRVVYLPLGGVLGGVAFGIVQMTWPFLEAPWYPGLSADGAVRFAQVWAIHYGVYAGAFAGLIRAGVLLLRDRRRQASEGVAR